MFNAPSPWLLECLKNIKVKKNKIALDLACGYGRHSYELAKQGFNVLALDNDEEKLSKVADKKIITCKTDVENFINWPLSEKKFDLIIVFNFLFRPIFPNIINSLNNGGYLIYETFNVGHSRFGSPKNKKYLLQYEELKKLTTGLSLIAYEDILVQNNIRSYIKQRIFTKNVCA